MMNCKDGQCSLDDLEFNEEDEYKGADYDREEVENARKRLLEPQDGLVVFSETKE